MDLLNDFINACAQDCIDGTSATSMDKAQTRSGNPSTSYAAAASVAVLNEKRKAVLALLQMYPSGLSDDQIVSLDPYWHKLPQSPSGIRTRRKELVELGLVVDSGRRAKTASGRNAIVWKIAEKA